MGLLGCLRARRDQSTRVVTLFPHQVPTPSSVSGLVRPARRFGQRIALSRCVTTLTTEALWRRCARSTSPMPLSVADAVVHDL
jgi:hypothetical protein